MLADRVYVGDSPQQQLGFVLSQLTTIEAEVYRTKYADIIYRDLIPIDTSGNPWSRSFTSFIIDSVGKADWWDGQAKDIPVADISRDMREQGIEMVAIGYRYNLQEIAIGGMVNLNVVTEKATASRRASEEFMDQIVRAGDTRKGMTGLINSALVTRTDAIQDGSSSGAARALWANKTADQIIRDVNSQLTQINTGSLGIEMADTILLPIDRMNTLATSRLSNTSMTGLEFLTRTNVYTNTTGKPLTIRMINGLTTAGSGGTARMVVYRYDRSIVELKVPMPYHFDQAYQSGPITYDVPGYLRTGGVQIRRPAAFGYLDGI